MSEEGHSTADPMRASLEAMREEGHLDEVVAKGQPCPYCGATDPPEGKQCTGWMDGPRRTVFCYNREIAALKAEVARLEKEPARE